LSDIRAKRSGDTLFIGTVENECGPDKGKALISLSNKKQENESEFSELPNGSGGFKRAYTSTHFMKRAEMD
jgi:hypothetical protein